MIPTTTRASWAKGLFESEAEFLEAQANGDAPGLELLYGEDGKPYLDEGECEGPLAEPDELIGLAQAAKEYPVAQSTMSQAAREGRLKAKKYGNSWLTTRRDIEEAITSGGLRPRS